MKIKEVMQNTGLSAKTIRYYEECGLISPEAEMINGRKYRDYSDNEIVRLKAIAALRKSLFSIDEISEMMNSPESTADVFENYKQRLSEQKEELEKILRCAENVKQGEDFDAFSLAGQMNYLAQDLPLPKRDVNPNFGKFDDETPEERAQAYLRFQKWYKFRFVKKLYPILVYFSLFFIITACLVIPMYQHHWSVTFYEILALLNRYKALYVFVMYVATIVMVVRATSKTYKMNFRFYRDNFSSAMAGGNKNSQAYQTSVLIQGKNPDEFLAVGNRGPTGTSGFSSIANFETGDKLTEEESDN